MKPNPPLSPLPFRYAAPDVPSPDRSCCYEIDCFPFLSWLWVGVGWALDPGSSRVLELATLRGGPCLLRESRPTLRGHGWLLFPRGCRKSVISSVEVQNPARVDLSGALSPGSLWALALITKDSPIEPDEQGARAQLDAFEARYGRYWMPGTDQELPDDLGESR